MSPTLFLRVQKRTSVTASICIIVIALVSLWATGQRAASGVNPDKGGITAEASTITVNSTSDVANSADGLCTLREAITAANNNVASGVVAGECAAGSGGSDVINLAVAGTINLSTALPDIASDITIAGPGSSQLAVRPNSVNFFRVLNIPSGTVSLSGFTVRDGRSPDSIPGNDGGGIRNLGTLTMNDVTVTSNQSGIGSSGGGIANQGTLTMTNCSVSGNLITSSPSSGSGGGIQNQGTLTMTNCLVSGNVSGAAGGGIAGSAMTIINSTISNNFSGNGGSGGGISGAFTLVNSTVSGNTTSFSPGGIRGPGGGISAAGATIIVGSTISGNTDNVGAIVNGGSLVVTNSTISGNHSAAIENTSGGSVMMLTNCTVTANDGNGVISTASSTNSTLRNTISASNGGTDLNGNFSSQGHNFIGRTPSNNFFDGVNGDFVGRDPFPLDPRLGPLANNGGPTLTHALLSNSQALDAGDNCVTQAAHCGDANISQLISDQRGAGFGRLIDGPDVDTTATVDIGAYETQTPLANLADTSTNEDTQLVVPFDVGDTSTITSVTASSSDSSLVPNDAAHLSAAITGSTGIVTINPAANLFGTTNITVTLNRTGGPEVKTFMLTVNSVNDAPSFVKGPDQSTNEDSGMNIIANWATTVTAGPADESGQSLTFQVTGNTNAALFSVAPDISVGGHLTYTLAANVSGSATITINLKDNGGTANGGVDTSASQSFTITVNSVNDAPSFAKGADQTVNEDAGPQSVAGWATAISRGPADESAQTLAFQVTGNTNTALFSAGPAVGSTGTLTYTPAPNANGSATITINLKDNGGTANGGADTSANQTLTITVNSVNDAPSFTKGANQTVNEDAAAQTINNWATAISAGPPDESGQTLTFQVTANTNTALFSAGPAISSTGVLTYTPAADANGFATLTINLKDSGGTTSGGVDTSPSQTFTITVNSVNDVPSFTKGADQTVNNNAGPQSVANWATNISRGPANEAGQTLTFQVTSNNTLPFSSGPAISSNGTLTYTPASDGGGTVIITVTLRDSGGTGFGGVDTSPSQTFTITVVPIGGFVGFTKGFFETTESSGSATLMLTRGGDTSRAVTVDYATDPDDGLPCSNAAAISSKCDFTLALGTLKFAAGQTSATITILISQDSFVEGYEGFGVTLSNPTGGAAIGPYWGTVVRLYDDVTEPATNAIDDTRNFVRQHYHDFLNREPDTSGWDFWTNQITSCGSDVQCDEVRRVDVSASFFLSIEFQQSGYLVERFYKTGYGDATGTSTFVSNHQLNVPMVRFKEFLRDTQRIGQGVVVLAPGWEQALENNKQAYALEFVQTTRFTTALPTTMTPAQFVDRLNQNTGGVLSLSERTTAINLFGVAANTSNVTARAQAVRMVADDTDLYNAEFNRAFVLAEYFGYLRRNPNDAPDSNYTGYDFWLTKLNQFNGSYINAEMVKAFLSSIEYRQRFGP